MRSLFGFRCVDAIIDAAYLLESCEPIGSSFGLYYDRAEKRQFHNKREKDRMSKAHASVDESLLLIKIKRRNAMAAMKEIVIGIGLPPHYYPNILTVLDYLTNNVSCIELMLKLLSGDWQSHQVGKMYETIFGKPHANLLLMDEICTALRDQKYLFEPNDGLLAHIGDLENLYDDVKSKLVEKYKKFFVHASIVAPATFAVYLRDHVSRFYSKKVTPTGVQEGPEKIMDTDTFLDALSQGPLREVREIRSHLDQLIQSGKPFEFKQTEIWTIE